MSKTPETLDDYLNQIERELRALPEQARADELREIEAHLRALVEAGQQLEDVGEAEATAAALKQFGLPRRVGRNLRKAWERNQPEAWWRAVIAPVAGLIFYIISTFVFWSPVFLLSKSQSQIFMAIWGIQSWYCILFAFSFAQFFGIGFIIERISPKYGRTLISLFLALSSLAFAFWLFTVAPPEVSAGRLGDISLQSVSYLSLGVALMFGSRFGVQRKKRISTFFE